MLALYCPADGWHRNLRDLIDRLRRLTDEPGDKPYWDLLVSEAGAVESDGCPFHLEGSMDRAMRVLRAREEAELRALLFHDLKRPSDSPP